MLFRVSVFSSLFLGLSVNFACVILGHAQDTLAPPPPAAIRSRQTPDPIVLQPIAEPPQTAPVVTRERRAESYAKLLEGQRYLLRLQNRNPQTTINSNARLAKAALARAVELNPGLSEGYTALAELTGIAGGSAGQVEKLAGYAVRFNPDNVGARRLIARIYTRESNLGGENFDRAWANKAVEAYLEISKIDARSAEAWAMLSEFYAVLGQTQNRLDALERWRGASQPQEDRFYRSITGKSLAPETAAVELGRALLKANRIAEAIRVLAAAAADNPDENAFSALSEAIEAANPADAANALTILRQIAFANPANPALLELLVDTQIRLGQSAAAVATLRTVIERTGDSDKNLQAGLTAKLGDVYAEAGSNREASQSYEQALTWININNQPLAAEAEREFAARVFPRLIAAYRVGGEVPKARRAIVRLNALLGTTDATADQQLVELLRATGAFDEALQTVRSARKRFPADNNLVRLEAEVLTDAGRVDEAATLLRSKIVNKTREIAVPASLVNDFLTHITISNLYTRTNRGADAALAANQALGLAQSDQMTNIALLTLATAQNSADDFKAAEATLRQVLKQEPNNATALNNLGYFMVERGERLSEAVELINRAVAREPNNSSFLDSLGWAHFKLGQLGEAEKFLVQAARRSPNSAAVQDHLGDLYQRQNKLNDARIAWRKALNLSKEAAESKKISAKLGENNQKK